jgi:lipoyl-dependent peroxiredoxin subunit D
MALEALRDRLPAYAKDLSLNLSSLASEAGLTEQQKWGAFLASAYAVGTGEVIAEVEGAAREAGLSEVAATAAKTAAAIMGMNNVYYRSLHLISNGEYRTLPARLRMNALASPGVPKADFELWQTAVSAINGCGACLDAHEQALRAEGLPASAVQSALRIAAVVNAVSRVIAAEAANAGAGQAIAA